MRILIAPHSYPPVLGGLQTVAHAVARQLLRRGHEVQVATNRYPRRLAPRDVQDGVPVRRWIFMKPTMNQLRGRRPDLFLASLYCHPASLMRFQRLVRSFRPEVVNVHFPDGQIAAVLQARRSFSFRLVVSLHGHDVERFEREARRGDARRSPYDRTALSDLLRKADAVTACSQNLLDKAARFEPSVAGKGVAIPNGVDPDRFADKVKHSHPRPYLFACGRLNRTKGFDLLLEAFSLAAADGPPVDLIVAGDGEERAALQVQSERLGLAERVRFLGRATPEQVVQLLNGCSFVVIPSRSETFGIVALESLAAGKPILATRVGGLCQLLAEFNAAAAARRRKKEGEATLAVGEREAAVMMVEPDVGDLAGGLRNWLSRRCSPTVDASDRAHVLEQYSWDRVAQRYEEALAA